MARAIDRVNNPQSATPTSIFLFVLCFFFSPLLFYPSTSAFIFPAFKLGYFSF